VVNNTTVKTVSKSKGRQRVIIAQDFEKPLTAPFEAPKPIPIIEEKVEVLIKEIIRIKPSDFSAFKHALEEFVNDWDK